MFEEVRKAEDGAAGTGGKIHIENPDRVHCGIAVALQFDVLRVACCLNLLVERAFADERNTQYAIRVFVMGTSARIGTQLPRLQMLRVAAAIVPN